MIDFDYIIIGGGCAGLSLAYEMDTKNKLKNKTLAIIETRDSYKRDKTWSFWKVNEHNFNDCIKKRWKQFSIKTNLETKVIKCDQFPYESIDSGLFYDKINTRLKKNKNIKFLGYVKNIEYLFNKASIVCLPSYREGFPKSLIEASASGCAIVCTNVPGCRDAIINNFTGLLVKPKSSKALKNAILRLSRNKKKLIQMSKNSRKNAIKKFNIDFVVDKHLKIYREINE